MSSISHPNIVRFYGCSLQVPRIGIVMEFCENGDVHEYLFKKKLDYPAKMKIMRGVVYACEYLHDRDIVHRDLKWGNVLLNDKLQPKLVRSFLCGFVVLCGFANLWVPDGFWAVQTYGEEGRPRCGHDDARRDPAIHGPRSDVGEGNYFLL